MKKLILCLCFLSFLKLQGQQYDITPLITGLNNPIAFAISNDGRYFVTLKEGIIKVFDSNGNFIQKFYDISDSTYNAGECGMLGICLDPQFATNHFLYVYYNHFDSASTATQPHIRVLRLTEINNLAVNPVLLLDVPELGNNHVGGNIHFPKFSNDKLFITIGENTVQANAQLLNNPYGKILRINSDGTIPNDNPFFDDGDPASGNDDRIWAYGLRNSFDFTFCPLNDSLYASENGPFQDDEINIIHPGSNYAWPTYTGVTNNSIYTDPVFTWTPTLAPTGILFYSDTTFPQFNNHLLVGMFVNGYIYDLTLGNAPYFDTVLTSSIAFNFGMGSAHAFTTLQKGSDGCIYALNGGFVIGTIYRICPGVIGIDETSPDGIEWIYVSSAPASDEVTVSYALYAIYKITLKIYDVTGRAVLTDKYSETENGIHHRKLRVTSLSNGIYFIKMEAASKDHISKTSTRKIAISR